MSSMYALLDKQLLSFLLLSFPSSSRHPFGFLPGFLCVVAGVFLLRTKREGVPEGWKGCVGPAMDRRSYTSPVHPICFLFSTEPSFKVQREKPARHHPGGWQALHPAPELSLRDTSHQV